jgi:hypothetical protein
VSLTGAFLLPTVRGQVPFFGRAFVCFRTYLQSTEISAYVPVLVVLAVNFSIPLGTVTVKHLYEGNEPVKIITFPAIISPT